MVDIETIKALLDSSNCHATALILQTMADDYHAMKDGFPDLLMSQTSGIRFIEVKAEGDVLRRNQLTRLRQLKQAGFECEIVRTQYSFNPNQDYVVDPEEVLEMKYFSESCSINEHVLMRMYFVR